MPAKPQEKSLTDQKLRLRRVSQGHVKNHMWPVEKKIECVTKYLAVGNMRLVSELTGVSYSLLRIWKMQDWWKVMEAEIIASRKIERTTKLSKIIDRSLEAISDRLENGEVFYNLKSGELDRRPVKLSDAVRAADSLMQREAALYKEAQNEQTVEATKSIEEQLTFLAKEFAKFNTKRTITQENKDVEDAVYEERKEGLREGETSV